MKALSFTVCSIASLAVGVGASPAPANHVLHEQRHPRHSHEWTKRSLASERTAQVSARFGLTQTNLAEGAEKLTDISDPASPNYGRHYSRDDVERLFAPSQSSIHSVTSWIRDSLPGTEVQLSNSRQWLHINTTVGQLERLLHADYHEYQHLRTGRKAFGCDEYYVPEDVHKHLDFVIPGVSTSQLGQRGPHKSNRAGSWPQPKTRSYPNLRTRSAGNDTLQCGSAVTPACVRALYNITDKLTGNSANSIGIFQTYDMLFNQSDLNLFFQHYAPEIAQGTTPELVSIDGAPTPGNNTEFGTGQEPNLDLQAVYPLVYPDRVINYQVGDEYSEGVYPGRFNSFLDALDKDYCNYTAFGETGDLEGVDPSYPDPDHKNGYNHTEQCGAFALPDVISISYNVDEDLVPMNYQRRQCNEWMKLGLLGVSVIHSSGDVGVSPATNRKCSGNDTVFAVSGPGNCPWVTSVGGTGLPPNVVPGVTPEFASTDFPNGGGFSNIFPTPEYQTTAVHSYFQDSPPPYPYYNITYNTTHTHGYYNRGGRGLPDVSAIGQGYTIYQYGDLILATGTSLSAPIFAGMIARINSFRRDAGKKTVGFLNPTLYANPHVFHDITEGNNQGCGTDGFSAVKGWDPVTGLGTPNYGKMKEVLMSLP